MKLKDFETMIGRAKYKLIREIKDFDDEQEQRRRMYVSPLPDAPTVLVPILIDGSGVECVDDWFALKIEALLDEEGYFQDD